MAMVFGKKAGSADYTVSMLPQNRKQVFFDVLKLHWPSFMGYGMLVMLFTAPMLLLTWAEDSYRYGVMKDFADLTDEGKQEAYNAMLSMNNARALLNIFLFLLLSVCLAGMIRVIRQYAWGENVSFAFDFFKGIRQNVSQMVLLGLFVGVVNAASVYSYNYASYAPQGPVSVALIMPVGLALLLGLPIAAYTAVCISIYNNKLFGNMKIGFVVFVKAPFKTLLALALCSLPLLPQFIPNMYCHIFGGLIGCILFPLVMLAWYLFASDQLDEYVNRAHFPSLAGKGTFPHENM